ncbi:MAG TPA: hypothetical protein VH210_14850 [Gaiellaceae bacterium]|nr:hypothetical protein [Gaiellaceae bacterium]
MRRASVLVALLALTGCGGSGGNKTRDDVSAYITRVDSIQLAQRQSIALMQQAVVDFSHGKNVPLVIKQLTSAHATLKKLHARIAAVAAPPPAQKLHRLVLELFSREAALTTELRDLAAFSPRFADALRPIAKANAAAKASITATKDPQAVAGAVQHYRTAVRSSLAAAQELHPPAVERPLYDAQVARLVALDRSLAQLIEALQARDLNAVARAEHATSVASVSSDTLVAQQAQRAAVVAYNRRAASVSSLARRVQLEVNRLQVALG